MHKICLLLTITESITFYVELLWHIKELKISKNIFRTIIDFFHFSVFTVYAEEILKSEEGKIKCGTRLRFQTGHLSETKHSTRLTGLINRKVRELVGFRHKKKKKKGNTEILCKRDYTPTWWLRCVFPRKLHCPHAIKSLLPDFGVHWSKENL